MPRLAALAFGLVVLAGCDPLTPDAPAAGGSSFEATYVGGRSGTFRGTAYAGPTSCNGLGCPGDAYQVMLDGTPAGRPPFTGGGVTFTRYGSRTLPPGRYDVGGAGLQGWITLRDSAAATGAGVPVRTYFVAAGTLTVTLDGDRLVGTFEITDSVDFAASDPDAPPDTVGLAVEGRFRTEGRG